MDALKEILEAMGTRVKSPILGSVLIAFIVVNWKVLFFVVFSKVKAVDKFEYFDAHTGPYSLFLIPLVFGVILAVTTPWISYGGMLLAKLPLEKRKKLQNETANKILLNKLKLEQSRKRLLVQQEETITKQEEAIIKRAIRDQNLIKGIPDEGIKERVQKEINEVRKAKEIDEKTVEIELLVMNYVKNLRKKHAPSSHGSRDGSVRTRTGDIVKQMANSDMLKLSEKRVDQLRAESIAAHINEEWNLVEKLENELIYEFNKIEKIYKGEI